MGKKIAYVSTYDARDIHQWSGLGYYISQALEAQNATIDFIGNLKWTPNFLFKVKTKIYRKLNADFDYRREPFVARQYAHQVKNALTEDSEVVFSLDTIPIAFLKTEKPIVVYIDATFSGMLGFYDRFSKLSNESIRHGKLVEKKALDNASLVFFSSDWAAETAIRFYNIHPDKIRVVPFGANIECSRTENDIRILISKRPKNECHLLFIGMDWERKGGDIAIEVVRLLNRMGIPAVLHVLGSDKDFDGCDYVRNHGFISKSTEEGRIKIDEILSVCHYLILPTRADCTPIVYSEANSFGLPVITTDVGGIPTIIKDEKNGKTFSVSATASDYANYIKGQMSSVSFYETMAMASFDEYKNRLNWQVAGKSLMDSLESL